MKLNTNCNQEIYNKIAEIKNGLRTGKFSTLSPLTLETFHVLSGTKYHIRKDARGCIVVFDGNNNEVSAHETINEAKEACVTLAAKQNKWAEIEAYMNMQHARTEASIQKSLKG
jgi:hypothetical protein